MRDAEESYKRPIRDLTATYRRPIRKNRRPLSSTATSTSKRPIETYQGAIRGAITGAIRGLWRDAEESYKRPIRDQTATYRRPIRNNRRPLSSLLL